MDSSACGTNASGRDDLKNASHPLGIPVFRQPETVDGERPQILATALVPSRRSISVLASMGRYFRELETICQGVGVIFFEYQK
jgi:hypothetical protein